MHAITQEEYDAMVALLNAKLEKYGQPRPKIRNWFKDEGIGCGIYEFAFPNDGNLKLLKKVANIKAKDVRYK